MIAYLAFLRGINVGGHKVIKMEDLRDMLTSMGLKDVKTIIQSGNVSFASDETDKVILRNRIQTGMREKLGYEVTFLLRTREEILSLVRSNPFGHVVPDRKTKLYVTFLDCIPEHPVQISLIQEKEGLELIRTDRDAAFVISREINGRYGFPNNFVEKELNMLCTTRNWNTVIRMVDLKVSNS
jgi:uncharacterized protein (DUF1697 family)